MARTEPARGMRDFLPEDVRRRNYVIDVITRVYERYGFEPLETPSVENIETLLGKYGEEGNQLIFKILKRGEHEASGQADLALRYDLTVPLARVVAHYQAKLPRLFKRYQIQPVWRADRPSKGRYREFYECDVDVVGSESLLCEVEVASAICDVLDTLGFNDYTVRLNHRGLLRGLIEASGVPLDLETTAITALDKLDKIGVDGVKNELLKRTISEEAATKLLALSLGPDIRVNAVAPGLVETPMTANWPDMLETWKARSPMKRPAKPEDIADLVAALIANQYVTGEILLADGGLYLT